MSCWSGHFPARTLPIGANRLDIIEPPTGPTHNVEMNVLETGWPASRGQDFLWRHSDIRDVAYVYVHRAYDQLVTLGNLAQ